MRGRPLEQLCQSRTSDGSTCGPTTYGSCILPYGQCSGSQSYTVQFCSSGSCVAPTQWQSCYTDGSYCADTQYGSCSYASACATTAYRTVTSYGCSGGSCVVTSSYSQACELRGTDSLSCGPTSYGSCDFPCSCANNDLRTRTRTHTFELQMRC
eukprot:TRINITY_DN5029_c1_g1_i2.p1 TRINITY_DN5029_c1_g1~~TRINITY_DN5029_c1_g1_i2.p1  ORF type:complete len:154 (-),score=3.22 TRINITY_DN5029_c1_g1_i2:35-496(-)